MRAFSTRKKQIKPDNSPLMIMGCNNQNLCQNYKLLKNSYLGGKFKRGE